MKGSFSGRKSNVLTYRVVPEPVPPKLSLNARIGAEAARLWLRGSIIEWVRDEPFLPAIDRCLAQIIRSDASVSP